MNRDEVDRLKVVWSKKNLTLKDLILVKLSFVAGEDAAYDVERHWDFVFEELEKVTGVKMEHISLASLIDIGKDRGRPIERKTADLLFKLLLFAPPEMIKKQEAETTRATYLSEVRVKDRRNPFYRKALAKAKVAASTRFKRVHDLFLQVEGVDESLYKLVASEVEKSLNPKPNSLKDGDAFLELAAEIGKAITQERILHGEHC